MAATTITRDSWTNDTGTAANPNADGTLLNNAVLQNHVYARIDALFASGTFTFGGLIAAEGFGSHNFTAGGTGQQSLLLRNTTAGTANLAVVRVGADASSLTTSLFAFSSTYTSAAQYIADASLLEGIGAGGLGLSATHASGTVRIYAGGSGTERMRVTAAGHVLVGDTSNADVTVGLTLNQGANDDRILALKSSDVAHGGVGAGVETDTFATFGKIDGNLGGLQISGFSEATTIATMRFYAQAASGSGDTTKSIAATGYFDFRAYEQAAAVGADDNLLVIMNANAAQFIFDAEGDSHQNVGTAWTNFDDHDDLALLHALSAGVSRVDDPLRESFGAFLETHRETLARLRIVTFHEDGHHFINWSRAHMLTIGAVRQLGMQLQRLEARLLHG